MEQVLQQGQSPKSQGKRVATIKHATHPVTLDREGTDTYRHFHEGMADGVLIASPAVRAVFERRPDDTDPETLARRHFADRDLVLVEGFTRAPIPKVEIWRSAVGPSPIILDPVSDRAQWIALLADTPVDGVVCPVLRFTDTMWLQVLASMTWDGARTVSD